MSVKICKLVTGEFAIGKMEVIKGENILTDVYVLNLAAGEGGRMNVNLFPLMFPFETEKSTATVHIDNIINAIDCPAELESIYTERNSGIILPKPSSPSVTPEGESFLRRVK